MTRVRELKNLKIDEISLVDKGANQHAMVTIAKRDGEEEQEMGDEFYDSSGSPVDVDSLSVGDVVYDDSGAAFELQAEEAMAKSDQVRETDAVVRKQAKTEQVRKNYGEQLREEFSKALSDKDRDEVLAKAFSALDEVSKAAEDAALAAEAERNARMTAEYTEVAKGYNVGVPAETLGPVLKRLVDNMPEDDVEVIVKALSAASDIVEKSFNEYGVSGNNSESDVLANVDSMVESMVSKGDGSFSREAAVAGIFETNPQAYDEYLAEQRQGR